MHAVIYLRCYAADVNTDMWIPFVPMNYRPTTKPDTHLSNPWDRSFRYSPMRPISFDRSGYTSNIEKIIGFCCCFAFKTFKCQLLTATAILNVNGPSGFLLHRSPASIFGSIISMADIASSNPNKVWWCTSSPSCNSVNTTQHKKFYCSPIVQYGNLT